MIMNNEVTNFMYYMFNKWSEEEAKDLYGELLGKHIYNKWIAARGDNLIWYGELDNECRQKVVDRANEIYN